MRVAVCSLSLLAIAIYRLFVVECFGPISGPYDLKVERMATCEDEGTGQVHSDVKISSKGHGVYTYSGLIRTLIPIDNTVQMDVEFQAKSNGMYIPRFFTHRLKGCEAMAHFFKDDIAGLVNDSDYNIISCPLPVGNYSLENWPASLQSKRIPNMVYGSYKMVVTISKAGSKLGCLAIYFVLIPNGTKS